MIFLTIGTHEPFVRLVRALDEWYAASDRSRKLFGQITDRGADAYAPRNFEWVERLSPVEYSRCMAQADLIVSHAGMGSIITALQTGKPIVIMPRRGHLHETRNDHQFTTVKHLGDRPGIHVAEDETRLGAVMDRALAALQGPGDKSISGFADPEFTDALRSFITGGASPSPDSES